MSTTRARIDKPHGAGKATVERAVPLLEQMLRVLDRENSMLRTHQLEEFAQLQNDKKAVLQELEQTFGCVEPVSVECENTSPNRQHATLIPDDWSTRAGLSDTEADRLRTLCQHIVRKNEVNGRIIASAVSRCSQSLAVLRGRDPQTRCYASDGRTVCEGTPRVLSSA